MNLFKTRNDEIINLEYIICIQNTAEDNCYRVCLRDDYCIYILKQDYDELCTRLFSTNK